MRMVNLLSASIRCREGVSDFVVKSTYGTFVLRMYLRLRLRTLVDNIILLQPNPEWLDNYVTDLIFQTSNWFESLLLYEKVISTFPNY